MDLYSHPLCRRKGGIPILFGSASLLPAAGINQGSSTLCIGFRLHSKHSCGSGPFQLANGWMAPYSCGGDLKFAATSTAEGMVISCQGRCAIAANEKRRNTSDPAKPLIFISLPPREDGVDYNKFQESPISFKSGPEFRKAVTRRHPSGTCFHPRRNAAQYRGVEDGPETERFPSQDEVGLEAGLLNAGRSTFDWAPDGWRVFGRGSHGCTDLRATMGTWHVARFA